MVQFYNLCFNVLTVINVLSFINIGVLKGFRYKLGNIRSLRLEGRKTRRKMAAAEKLYILYVLNSVLMISATTIDDLPLDMQQELSMQTLHTWDLNYTHFRKFGIKDMESAMPNSRRYRSAYYGNKEDSVSWHDNNAKHPFDTDNIGSACFFIQITYRAALQDLHTYFEMRQLYLNTFEFELGYMINQIVYHYETILELYHMISTRFEHRPGPLWNTNLAPPPYMFFIYKVIVAHTKETTLLIDMLHELPMKYRVPGTSIWDDYHKYSRSKGKGNRTMDSAHQKSLIAYMRKKAKEKRDRMKKSRNKRKKFQKNQDFHKSTWRWAGVTRKPKRSDWPLHYGWSIEDTWSSWDPWARD